MKKPIALRTIEEKYGACEACSLHERAMNYVFWRGACPCDVLFVGEAPGKDENLYGEPFIGLAGQLLDKMIREARKELPEYLSHFTAGFCNIVCCRPLDDNNNLRPPSKDEAKACSPRYVEAVSAANPRLVVLLGNTAKTYHKMLKPLAYLPILELKHPSHLLRNGDGVGSYPFNDSVLRLAERIEEIYGEEEIPTKDREEKGPSKKRNKEGNRSISLQRREKTKASKKSKTKN